jgi:hypothetical protein
MDLSGKIIKGTGSFDVKEIAPPTLSGQLIENPNFENWTSDTPDDWNIVQDATNYITEDQDGGCRVVRVNGSVYLYQGGITEDKYFKAVLTVSKFGTGGSCALGDGSTPYLVLTSANAVGVHTVYFRSISTFDRIYLTFSNGTDITINSLTVEEVPEGYPLLDKGSKYLECTSNWASSHTKRLRLMVNGSLVFINLEMQRCSPAVACYQCTRSRLLCITDYKGYTIVYSGGSDTGVRLIQV